MKKYAFLILLISLFVLNGFAEKFEFKYEPGIRYQVSTEIVEDVDKNGDYSHTSRMMIMEWLNVVDKREGEFLVAGDYIVSENTSSLNISYQIKNNYFNNLFKILPNGAVKGDEDNFMPVKRNFPFFIEDVQRGEPWFVKMTEVHDFRGELFGIDHPFRVPSAIMWTYEGLKEDNGNSYAYFTGKLSILHQPSPVDSLYRLFPVEIRGYSDVELYWNKELNLVHKVNENFDITFDISDGQDFRYKGKSTSTYKKMEAIDPLRYEELVRLMQERFGEGVVVDRGAGWVRITLNNINFGPEDYQLTALEEEKLESIAEELQKHAGRFIRVVGHTAMAGTEAGRNSLSVLRANQVRDYLIESGAVDANLITSEGKGATEQVDLSGTKAGMQANRRVEIYIMVGNEVQ